MAITYTYRMPTAPKSSCQLAYEVYGDGTVRTTLSYDPVVSAHSHLSLSRPDHRAVTPGQFVGMGGIVDLMGRVGR